MVVRADVRAPVNITNFFGLGNNTVVAPTSGEDIRYYRARYNMVNVSALLRRQMQSWMQVMLGPTFQYFKLPREENSGKFVNNHGINGLDPTTLYLPHSYLGAEFGLAIDNRNNRVLPSRGVLLDAGYRQFFGLNRQSSNLGQFRWDMSIFLSLVPRSPYVLATRFGYYRNFGRFEFPQANYLSGPDNLRGFRRDRFGGRTMFFNNTEFRLRLTTFNTYLFPGSLGLVAFHDVGRVWQDNEKSSKWHNGYGGGIWIAPIQRFVISAMVAHSQEDNILPYFRLGFQF
jgi:outer membrane protein assembly factor BamA